MLNKTRVSFLIALAIFFIFNLSIAVPEKIFLSFFGVISILAAKEHYENQLNGPH